MISIYTTCCSHWFHSSLTQFPVLNERLWLLRWQIHQSRWHNNPATNTHITNVCIWWSRPNPNVCIIQLIATLHNNPVFSRSDIVRSSWPILAGEIGDAVIGVWYSRAQIVDQVVLIMFREYKISTNRKYSIFIIQVNSKLFYNIFIISSLSCGAADWVCTTITHVWSIFHAILLFIRSIDL